MQVLFFATSLVGVLAAIAPNIRFKPLSPYRKACSYVGNRFRAPYCCDEFDEGHYEKGKPPPKAWHMGCDLAPEKPRDPGHFTHICNMVSKFPACCYRMNWERESPLNCSVIFDEPVDSDDDLVEEDMRTRIPEEEFAGFVGRRSGVKNEGERVRGIASDDGEGRSKNRSEEERRTRR